MCQKALHTPLLVSFVVPAFVVLRSSLRFGETGRRGEVGVAAGRTSAWHHRPASGTHLKTRTGGLSGVPVERRCATGAIRLHDPNFTRTPKNILFPGNKKSAFLQIF